VGFEGSLGSFGMTEIFQLIATQAKTGVLEIETEEGVTRVRFVNGQLLDAFPAKSEPAQSIGAILVRAGYITQRQLDYALQTQQRTLRRLGDILIRMGAIRTSDFQAMLALQRRELAFSLLRTKRGKYSFHTRAVDYEKGVDTLLSVDAILMEGSRQLDEWPSVLKRIPSDQMIYKRIEGAEPNRELNPDEALIYSLSTEPRTVREYIDRACLGEFRGWDSLANLQDLGLVEVVRQKKETREETKKKRSVSSLAPAKRDVLTAALLIAAAFAILYTSGFTRAWHPGLLGEAIGAARSDLRALNTRVDEWATRRPENWPSPVEKSP
jgi:hypothetical protein